MNRRIFHGSRVNRDRRDQSFARFVIAEATRRFNNSIEVCPDCLGLKEIVRQVADGVEREAPCLECDGKGWIK